MTWTLFVEADSTDRAMRVCQLFVARSAAAGMPLRVVGRERYWKDEALYRAVLVGEIAGTHRDAFHAVFAFCGTFTRNVLVRAPGPQPEWLAAGWISASPEYGLDFSLVRDASFELTTAVGASAEG